MSIEHWVWLTSLHIDRRLMHRLLDRFADPQRVYEATESELRDLALGQKAQKTVLQAHDLRYAKAVLSLCAKKNISIVTMQDAAYPNRLKNIEVPPLLLYVGGRMPSFDEEAAIAVVGTRKSSDHANDIAYTFGYELADKGMLVVSGMAAGIDTSANSGALSAGARTVAVLGGGVDVCYPASSRKVYDRILAGNGCLISEYPPGERPYPQHFPERNRIISGLSAGVLVIAAPERSGSLITASRALEQGREIFVVPGNIDDAEFIGSNNLIKHGAIPVTTPKDIIAYYYARFQDVFNAAKVADYMQDRAASAELAEFHRRPPALHVASAPSYAIEGKQLGDGAKKQSRSYDFGLFSMFSQKVKKNSHTQPVLEAQPSETVSPRKKEDEALRRKEPAGELSQELQKIVAVLTASEQKTVHIDEIVNYSGFPVSEVLSMLTELELEGIVVALPGKRFQIIE